VDAQHKILFSIARELHQAMLSGQAKQKAGEILDRLVTYVATHFSHEEKLMQQHGYPGLVAHKAQHDALSDQVLKFRSDFRAGKVALTVSLLDFVRKWLVDHIQNLDQQYAPFLREKAET